MGWRSFLFGLIPWTSWRISSKRSSGVSAGSLKLKFP
nr:MAG TPA: hypothetical protein [Caudoviricetes sp.]